jgi:Na+-transporting methylmalonyl-CoA/oxaloacetate decarboxylase gamma subunit
MGTTFAVLILISLIISSFALLGKRKEKPSQSAPVEDNIQAIDQTIAQIIAKEEREGTDDSELVAVIAAAIAAAEGTTTEGFRVRSIRRANTSKWKQA